MTLFVSRLEYSRFTVASVVPDQTVETCARTLVAHYGVMGGVPLLAAFDWVRPLGLGSDKDGKVTEWDPAFAMLPPAGAGRRGPRATRRRLRPWHQPG